MVKTYDKKKDIDLQLSKNFKLSEFDCKCKREECSTVLLDDALVDILQKIRDHFGVPVNVNSGHRCQKHNAAVGGSTSSHHMRGMAADIWVKGVAPKEVAKYAESIGVKRIGLYEGASEGNFVHIGSADTKRFWLGHAGKLVDTFGGVPVNGGKDPTKYISMELPVLKKGMKCPTVGVVQALLIGMGYDLGKTGADESFGGKTENAVMSYQEDADLEPDGSVGRKTWSKLLGLEGS